MTTRPTDEATRDMIAEWKGKMLFKGMDGKWGHEPKDGRLPDPRDDTDAALELLHWVVGTTDCGYYWSSSGWNAHLEDTEDPLGNPVEGDRHIIPISGQPFRYAVVALAIRVIGVPQ